ncbi:MAG: asparagine synthase (glutamine-hydrolyzing) [Thermodesulfovibrionales bacterium]
MCGVCGIMSDGRPDLEADIRAMTRRMSHRGPDDSGVWVAPGGSVGLGHTRLSIIDLSAAGHQPMAGDDGRYVISYNGEVYNFQEIRAELEALGVPFRSRTDTEVVLKSFARWGTAAFEKFNGMFAFSIWDERARELYLVRDRLGVKPLYYCWDGRELLWASELAPIRGLRRDLETDPFAAQLYFALSYIPAPYTIYGKVYKLMPGHFLRVSGGRLQEAPYWRPSFEKADISEDEAVEELDALIGDAVRKRLVSDVPLGGFLSGGLDSSSVAAFMAGNGGRVKTFSIGFKERDFDESRQARQVADFLGTEHHEFTVEPGGLEVLDKMTRHFGEPFGDASALPTYYLSAMARGHVTVALSGDGGDEIFCGYEKYAGAKYSEIYRRLPRAVRAAAEGAVRLAPRVGYRASDALRRVERFLAHSRLTGVEREMAKKSVFRAELRAALLGGGDGRVEEWLGERLSRAGVADETDRLSHGDLSIGLPDDILVKVDRMSMAHSLEVRSPFLDYRLVEFCISLPPSVRMPGLGLKPLLRRCMRKRLPYSTVQRKKKGFNVPFKWWLRKALNRDAEALMAAPGGRLDNSVVEALLDEHRRGISDNSSLLWTIMIWKSWEKADGLAA